MKHKKRFILLNFTFYLMTIAIVFIIARFTKPTKVTSSIYEKNINNCVEICSYDSDSNLSYGTGWFIDEQTIVTNYHVVNTKTTSIRFFDEETYTNISIINFDSKLDIALLKYEGTHVHSYFKTTTNYITSEECYCIGNYQNFGLSFKKGYISLAAVDLEYNEVYQEFIQCSIGIGQGDSGAPLFNQNYECLGMITLRKKNQLGNIEECFGYAIPISKINELKSKINR